MRESSLVHPVNGVHRHTGKGSVSVPVERGSDDVYRLAGLRPLYETIGRRGDKVACLLLSKVLWMIQEKLQ